MMFLKAFLIGGLICVVGQLLLDLTKLTPARILVGFVVVGVILGGIGVYKYVEEYAPELFSKIQELVKKGKWHIMGGWYLQPDCNMPSGEGFVRNILAGRRYFWEKFGVKPTTAINFDAFGHTRGLVQILKKCGQDSYMFNCPNMYSVQIHIRKTVCKSELFPDKWCHQHHTKTSCQCGKYKIKFCSFCS